MWRPQTPRAARPALTRPARLASIPCVCWGLLPTTDHRPASCRRRAGGGVVVVVVGGAQWCRVVLSGAGGAGSSRPGDGGAPPSCQQRLVLFTLQPAALPPYTARLGRRASAVQNASSLGIHTADGRLQHQHAAISEQLQSWTPSATTRVSIQYRLSRVQGHGARRRMHQQLQRRAM